jgi:branched-chain amino acid transport system permease protein
MGHRQNRVADEAVIGCLRDLDAPVYGSIPRFFGLLWERLSASIIAAGKPLPQKKNSTSLKGLTCGLSAIKQRPDAAQAMGVNISLYKQYAFMISALFTAICGSFYAMYVLHIEPATVLSLDISARFRSCKASTR